LLITQYNDKSSGEQAGIMLGITVAFSALGCIHQKFKKEIDKNLDVC
jgi:hypothetical protein